jgi:hypothetical protein
MVAGAYRLFTAYGASLPAIALPGFLSGLGVIDPEHQHEAWRYTLLSGLIPALPLILIRPFLPESPVWSEKKAAGLLRRPSLAELFRPEFRRTTIVTTILFACAYGAAFGAIQQMPQIVPGVPEIQKQTEGKPVPAQKQIEQAAAGTAGIVQETGGLVGRFLLAILALKIVSRRKLLRVFQLPGLIVIPLVFAVAATTSWHLLLGGAFLAGFFTVAQFSFWGNYLPRAYPVHLRGTGEGFAANVGGRLFGTMFYGVTQFISGLAFLPGSPATKLAYASALVGGFVYLTGSIASMWLPEPRSEAELAD